MKIVKKILRWIVILIIGVITLFNIYNLVNTKILKNDLTTINSYAMLEVVSGSMEPSLNIGDLVIIDIESKDYKIGDIVTYKDENNLFVTHRILYINDDKYVLKGDANNAIDKPINSSQIVGKYVSRVEYVGNIIRSIRNPFSLVIILLFGIIICIILSLDEDDDDNEKEKIEREKERNDNRKLLNLKKIENKETRKVVKKYSPKKEVKETTKKESGKTTKQTAKKNAAAKNVKTVKVSVPKAVKKTTPKATVKKVSKVKSANTTKKTTKKIAKK